MIVLDTHIWVWWVHGDVKLPADYQAILQKEEEQGFGISAISCWEIAKLVEYNRLQLPGEFHRDPADQIIVATARIHNCPIMTMDEKILAYPHVQKRP